MTIAEIIKLRIELKKQYIILLEPEIGSLEEILESIQAVSCKTQDQGGGISNIQT